MKADIAEFNKLGGWGCGRGINATVHNELTKKIIATGRNRYPLICS